MVMKFLIKVGWVLVLSIHWYIYWYQYCCNSIGKLYHRLATPPIPSFGWPNLRTTPYISFHLAILSSYNSVVLTPLQPVNVSFLHPVIPSSCHFFILPFFHPVIPTSCHSFILSFPHPVIPSSCHSFILSLLYTVTSSSCHSFILSFFHPVIHSSCSLVI